MDRLQQAISKARRERSETVAREVQTPVAAAISAARQASAEPGAQPAAPAPAPERVAEPAGDLNSLWSAFQPLQITAKSVQRNRLMAFSTGEHAIPYDMLRTRILQVARKNNWKRIAIVSPESAVGKTTITGNLAFSFSRMRDRRTMVLDFDMRRMGLGELLGVKPKHNMADVLKRRVSFADHGMGYDGNVVFGLNRERTPNAAELLQDPECSEVLDEIEEIYHPDIMLFDTAPLMASDDSHGFLQLVDCALLVVAAERTPMERIDVAERQLAELTNVMGIVLNRCRYTGGAHGYENDYY